MQHNKGNDMKPIVSCKGITKVFGKGELAVHALRGIDLDIMEGDFATLAGPSAQYDRCARSLNLGRSGYRW